MRTTREKAKPKFIAITKSADRGTLVLPHTCTFRRETSPVAVISDVLARDQMGNEAKHQGARKPTSDPHVPSWFAIRHNFLNVAARTRRPRAYGASTEGGSAWS